MHLPQQSHLKLFCRSDILVDSKEAWIHVLYLGIMNN